MSHQQGVINGTTGLLVRLHNTTKSSHLELNFPLLIIKFLPYILLNFYHIYGIYSTIEVD